MKNTVIAATLVFLAGCHTFTQVKPDYTDMPADAMRAVAIEIEQIVADGNRDGKLSEHEGLVVDGEAVQHAVRTRAARSELIDAFRDTGHAWERRNGLLDIIPSKEYKRFGSSQDRSRNALLVMSENDDRWAIYENILRDSNIKPKSLSAVQHIFCEVRLEFMGEGQKYENDAGTVAYIDGR